MTVHYLDSSAWVKHHVQEPGHRWVRRLLTEGHPIVCASIASVEVLSAVARRANLSPARRVRFITSVRRELAAFEVIHLTSTVLDRAMEIPFVYRLRGADAIHLSCAMAYRESMTDEEMMFVSSDRDLLGAAHRAGFDTVDPIDG